MPYNYNSFPGYNYGYPTSIPPVQPPQSVPQMQSVTSAPVGFACRPVTSKAEAETAQVPFDGSTTYFVDTSSGEIYAKTFNFNTGAAPIVTYIPEPITPPVQYATVDDLNALREEFMKARKAARKSESVDE